MELDTSILESKQSTTTTMADMYGYSVFSKEFQQKLTSGQAREQKEQEYYLDCVFANKPENEAEAIFQRIFKTETALIVKEDFMKNSTKEIGGIGMMGFTILGALLAGGVWLVIERIRKGKKVRENYDNGH